MGLNQFPKRLELHILQWSKSNLCILNKRGNKQWNYVNIHVKIGLAISQ